MLLVICDLDVDYAKGLINQLKRREHFSFEIQLVTTLEHLNDVEHEITLLLLDEKLEGANIHNKVKHVLYLSENLQDKNHIKRYQSIDRIVMQMEGQIQCKDKEEAISTFETGRIIAVYSPMGGSDQTYLATSLAQRLAENQKKVYYFDFGLVPSLSADKVPDFCYDLRQKCLFQQDAWSTYFEKKDKWHCVYTSLYNNELWNVDKDDIEYLVSGLRERDEVAYYIFDIGFINFAMIEMLKGCDYWFAITRVGEVETLRLKNLKKLLQFRKGGGLEEKLVEVDGHNGLEEIWRRLVL